jgi:glycosyltransferase involved in cell wall biosynthesis
VRVEALLLTHNEAQQVRGCLESLAPANRIVVIDSGSVDGTLDIVAGFPRTTIVRRPFTGFADQRNHGLDHHITPDSWAFHVDADERLPAALWAEIAALTPPADATAYNVASRTFLGGHPVLRASAFPTYQTRLTRAGGFRFEQVGHGQKAPAHYGPLPRLRQPYDHHPFEKGFDAWRRRHEAYADQEACDLFNGDAPSLRQAARDPIARRQWLKHATARVPVRPALVWTYLMLVRGGVFDGRAGWEYCRLRYLYEQMVQQRVRASPSHSS